ncbi:MAG: hypothetical protein GXO17_02640 [Thermodesulfobacteria bacterium]|nr:hypothetical protein [Thermodesulfobacteriota bacterium]
MKTRRPFWDIWILEKILECERLFYILVALLILVTTGVILADGIKSLFYIFQGEDFGHAIIQIMDHFLLALMFLEILHTVQIVFGEEYHLACVEPFLMVAIIASVRRLLIITFESSHAGDLPPEKLRYYFYEMLIIGFLILVMVAAVVFLRRTRNK